MKSITFTGLSSDGQEDTAVTIFEYGDRDADDILIQMVGDHDKSLLEAEAEEIGKGSAVPFRLVAVLVDDWNRDLSPWKAPAEFGSAGFGDGASATLEYVLDLCTDRTKNYYIGGYSLSALFALWSATKSAFFKGVAAASPSVWFPGFTAYMRENPVRTTRVYLSLGDREAKTRSKTMATVADDIIECRDIIGGEGVRCFFEWNEGGHFSSPEKRTAKAFLQILNSISE